MFILLDASLTNRIDCSTLRSDLKHIRTWYLERTFGRWGCEEGSENTTLTEYINRSRIRPISQFVYQCLTTLILSCGKIRTVADRISRMGAVAIGERQADEFTYWNFFLDWGPHSLGNVYRFCRTLDFKLRSNRLEGKVTDWRISCFPSFSTVVSCLKKSSFAVLVQSSHIIFVKQIFQV